MPWQVQTNMHWHAQGTRRPDGGAVTSWRPPCPSRQSKRSRRTRPGPSLAGVTTNLKDPKRATRSAQAACNRQQTGAPRAAVELPIPNPDPAAGRGFPKGPRGQDSDKRGALQACRSAPRRRFEPAAVDKGGTAARPPGPTPSESLHSIEESGPHVR